MGGAPPLPRDFAPQGGKNGHFLPIFHPSPRGSKGGILGGGRRPKSAPAETGSGPVVGGRRATRSGGDWRPSRRPRIPGPGGGIFPPPEGPRNRGTPGDLGPAIGDAPATGRGTTLIARAGARGLPVPAQTLRDARRERPPESQPAAVGIRGLRSRPTTFYPRSSCRRDGERSLPMQYRLGLREARLIADCRATQRSCVGEDQVTQHHQVFTLQHDIVVVVVTRR